MSRQRLQKLMAAAGLCSRRKAEQWLQEGRVTVNARVASLGAVSYTHLTLPTKRIV